MQRYINRTISQYAFREDWIRSKMVFLAGPRQVGKTHIALNYLKKHSSLKLYYNWDIPETAERYRQNSTFFESDARQIKGKRPTIVFDEIHKRSRWKNELKGIYDQYIEDFNIVVTGSARLDLLRQTGESLAGRYFLFRVLPVGLQEYVDKISFHHHFNTLKELKEALNGIDRPASKALEELLLLGGFPDPLSHGALDYRNKWAVDYKRLVLREDLRDLSRIQEIDRIENLWSLLPQKIGSPLSIKSLQEDLRASHEAIRTWLLNLEKLYSIFFINPYSKRITRGVKKEKKIYLMDWALHKDKAKRFENFVMQSLFRSICIWNDTGQGEFDLQYVRNVLKQEADFLILKDGKPWLIGDIKLSAQAIDAHIYRMAAELGNIPVLQIVYDSGVFQTPNPNAIIVSADKVFLIFP